MSLKITVNTRIRFNGQDYHSVEEMPPPVRQAYEQAMAKAQQTGAVKIEKTSTKLVVNGQEYGSTDDLPPALRHLYDQAMGALDANKDGIPDVLESGHPAPTPHLMDSSQPFDTTSLAPQSASGSTFSFNSRVVIVAVVLVLLVLGALMLLVTVLHD